MAMQRLFLSVIVTLSVGEAALSADPAAGAAPVAGDVFSERILPILRSKNASSCTECHFVGVELSDYLFEDQAETFAALKSAGLIDVEHPDRSKILTFIARQPESPNPDLQQVREREYEAFRAWLRIAVREPALLSARTTSSVGTELPAEVIRHARRDRVLSSFVDNVWSEMGRCVNCHSPEKNRQAIKKHGKELVEQISWIVPRDPVATLERLVADGDIDLDHPEQSPMLTKPAGLEDHGGGRKFLVGGPAYANFLTFLTDYAAIRRGAYQSSDDLPPSPTELTLLTSQHLRLTGLPADWGEAALRVDLYRWDEETRSWSEERSATAYNNVVPQKHFWQSPMSILVPIDSPHADELRARPLLPTEKYLARFSLDRGLIADDSGAAASEPEFIGQVEVSGDWPPGHQLPKVVDFASIQGGGE